MRFLIGRKRHSRSRPFLVRLIRIAACFCLAAAAVTFSMGSSPPPDRPNLLLITVDTLRPDHLSVYDPKNGKTPNIDALAEKGAVFHRAFAHNPTTLPSHANILTGTTPLRHGVHDNALFKLSVSCLTLAEHLRTQGYATGAFIGAFPLDSRFGLNQGFDVYNDTWNENPVSGKEFLGFSERPAGAVISAALEWIEESRSPWFVWMHIWDPHMPYAAPEPFRSWYRDKPYFGEVAYVDSEIGKMVDFMDNRGSLARTVMILTADHGESLGEHGEPTHGFFAYNSTLHVPLIITGPGVRPGRVDKFAAHSDIFPTACALLGLPVPPGVQGLSLLPAMAGRKLEERAIYIESLSPHLTNGWAPVTGLILPRRNRKYLRSPLPEVYDLGRDFGESRNLADRSSLIEYQEELKALERALSADGSADSRRIVDRETREKLNTLGYAVSAAPVPKRVYGAEHDLKTLIRFQNSLDEAIGLFNSNRGRDSIERFREILTARPDFVSAYVHLADAYRSMGRTADALLLMEEGIERNPDNYSLLFSLGSMLVEEGRLDRGIEVLNRAVARVDFDIEAWNSLGIAHWRKGELENALVPLEKALVLNPKNDQTLVNLGTVLLSLGQRDRKPDRIERAEKSFRDAAAANPRSATAYNGLGVVFRMRGKVDEAAVFWEKAVEINPDHGFALLNLGRAYLDLGRKDKALSALGRYLERHGNGLSARDKQEVRDLIDRCLRENGR